MCLLQVDNEIQATWETENKAVQVGWTGIEQKYIIKKYITQVKLELPTSFFSDSQSLIHQVQLDISFKDTSSIISDINENGQKDESKVTILYNNKSSSLFLVYFIIVTSGDCCSAQ